METLLRSKDYIQQENIRIPETVLNKTLQEKPHLIPPELFKPKPVAKQCGYCGVLFVPLVRESFCSPSCVRARATETNAKYAAKKKLTSISVQIGRFNTV